MERDRDIPSVRRMTEEREDTQRAKGYKTRQQRRAGCTTEREEKSDEKEKELMDDRCSEGGIHLRWLHVHACVCVSEWGKLSTTKFPEGTVPLEI